METIRYTPLDETAETVKERQANEALQAKLVESLGNKLPQGPFEAWDQLPSAVLAEYVARPTGRDLMFAQDAIEAGLVPWWLTYKQDRFTTTNAKKVGMLRPPLAMPKGQDTRRWIVPEESRGGAIGDRPTIYASIDTVSDYWRYLRMSVMPTVGLAAAVDNVLDISAWYRLQAFRSGAADERSLASYYYPAIMGLYATRAALFLDFESYPEFKSSVAVPAFEAAATMLGADPVVVRWQPPKKLLAQDKSREINYDQTDLTWLGSEDVRLFQQTGRVAFGGILSGKN